MSAIGSEPFTYKWMKDGKDIVNLRCTGIQESTLKIDQFLKEHQGSYTCIVSDGQMFVESNSADLTLSKY